MRLWMPGLRLVKPMRRASERPFLFARTEGSNPSPSSGEACNTSVPPPYRVLPLASGDPRRPRCNGLRDEIRWIGCPVCKKATGEGSRPARVVHQYNAMRPYTSRKLANARPDPIELKLCNSGWPRLVGWNARLFHVYLNLLGC